MTENEIGKGFANGVSLNNSSNNYFFNNLIGLIDNGSTYLEALPSVHSGVYLDSLSNNNNFRSNYIVGHGRYGFENYGNNDVAVNYVACNDSSNFYYHKLTGNFQNTLNAATLIYNVSNTGQAISLSISGLSALNGFKAHIYRKTNCTNYNKTNLEQTYVDSVTIAGGLINYTFGAGSGGRTTKRASENDIFYLIIMDSQFNLIGSTKDSEKSIALAAEELQRQYTRAYPNPSSGLITVSEAVAAIYNINGEVVQKPLITDLSLRLVPGIYYFQYQSGEGEKVVVR